MKKRIISLFLVLAVSLSMFCPLAFADDSSTHEHDWSSGIISEFSDTVEGIPVSVSVKKCTKCNFYKHTYKFFGLSFDFYNVTAYTGIVDDFLLDVTLHISSALGKNATAKKYETGGGSAGTGGVGRNPSGYSGTGTPSVAANGEIQYTVYPELGASQAEVAAYPTSFVASNGNSGALLKVAVNGLTCNVTSTFTSSNYLNLSISCRYSFTTPVAGRYYLAEDQKFLTHVLRTSASSFGYYSIGKFQVNSNYNAGKSIVLGFYGPNFYATKSISSYTAYFHPIVINCIPTTTNINNYNKITINNNTWNGNIYQDNSTNLTYIYPQYTTINNEGDTITNISNNPIIYNNETKQYYTYDTVTNNYYYITYEAPTPSPSPDPTPTPDPGTDPTPTPEPGGDTGDTIGIIAVLVEIRDNMIQGFADIKATLVQGWADLSANFTLAIENFNLNITNIFNKKFPDQSTPETAEPSPSPSPSPSPEPSPSPTPDPGETPTPTPAPTDKPSNGNTNNFWNFVFPGGNDDGTENGHKGILWALISLLIAVVTFVLGLGSAYSYVFPFLPAGLVTTIHICVLVLLLFAIIKFVRSFL